MKKNLAIILMILTFILGFSLSKIYPLNVFGLNKQNNLISGVYNDLYFSNLRKEGDSYYIKFNKQLEDKKFPAKCYLTNGEFRPDNEEIEGCFGQGRPMQVKESPDIDLNKEYKFIPYGAIASLTQDKYETSVMYPIPVEYFYEYIANKTQFNNLEHYEDFIMNASNLPFEVTIVNGEVAQMSQIYQE